MKRRGIWLICVLLATLAALSTVAVAETILEIPHPAADATLAEHMGEMTPTDTHEGYVHYAWPLSSFFAPPDGEAMDPKTQADVAQANFDMRTLMRDWYTEQCEMAGYALANEDVDENGCGFSCFNIGDTMFVWYIDETSVQMMIPDTARLSAPPQPTKPPFADRIQPSATPTPKPLVTPAPLTTFPPATAIGAPFVAPNPASLSMLANAGDAVVTPSTNDLTNYRWNLPLTAEEQAALHDEYLAMCEAAGFVFVSVDTDPSGYVLRFYQPLNALAEDAPFFALYASNESVQMLLPPNGTLAPLPSASPAPIVEGPPYVIPNPRNLAQLAHLGEPQQQSRGEYVNLNWTVTLSDADRAAIHDAYQALCEAAGYPFLREEKDGSGNAMRYYQAGNAYSFALFMSRASVQLLYPEGVLSLADLPAATPAPSSLIDLLEPDAVTNWYVRGTYNGEENVTFKLTGVSMTNKRSYIRLMDETGRNHIEYLSIDYKHKFVERERYRIDRNTQPPGFEIYLILHSGRNAVYDTDFKLYDKMGVSDYVEFCVTKTGTNPTLIGGTLSFSLGGGAFVLENGEFLGFTE